MYNLDVNSARKADSTGQSIKELGKYVGEFTQAKALKSKNTGAVGVEFAFKSQSGQKANLSIYTMSAKGDLYQGYDALMAIMTCMGLRSIKPIHGIATKYDFDTKKEAQEECEIFPDLCKPIGVLLETEDYQNQKGEISTRMILKHVFRPADEFTASEILDRKTSPELLPKFVAGLRHRPIKGVKSAQTNGHQQATIPPMHASGFSDMEDEIPF